VSIQSSTGSRGVRISGSNAGYTMFRGSVKSTGYPFHSTVSSSLPPPLRHCVPSHFNWTLQERVKLKPEICRYNFIMLTTPCSIITKYCNFSLFWEYEEKRVYVKNALNNLYPRCWTFSHQHIHHFRFHCVHERTELSACKLCLIMLSVLQTHTRLQVSDE
jgi:hypothetical protein